MGLVALIRKNTGVLGGAGHYNLCWSEYLGGFFDLVGGWGDVKLQFVIRIKLCWSDYKLMLPIRL